MKYGVYDTDDHCWIGTDQGPATFDDESLAMIAAQVTEVQLRWTLGRLRARPYDGTGTKVRDELTTALTPEQALKRIEDGGF